MVKQNQLTLFKSDNNQEVKVVQCQETHDFALEVLTALNGGTGKVKYDVTTERQQNLLRLSEDHLLVHNTPVSMNNARGLTPEEVWSP